MCLPSLHVKKGLVTMFSTICVASSQRCITATLISNSFGQHSFGVRSCPKVFCPELIVRQSLKLPNVIRSCLISQPLMMSTERDRHLLDRSE